MNAATEDNRTCEELRLEVAALRQQLQDATQIVEAIRSGTVDALVTRTEEGIRVFTLAEAHTPYRTFVEGMRHGAATIGPDGTVLYCNRSLAALLRTPVERIVGEGFARFVAPEDQDRLRQLLDREAGESVGEEYELVTLDGNHIPVSITATRIPMDGLIATCLVFTDLTRRKEAERAVYLQADRYASLLATTSDGFWVFDADARLLEVNEAYCRMSGYSREELLALRIPDLEARESPDEVAAHIRQVMGGGFDRFESQHRARDGRLFDVEISVSYWRATGQFLLFVRDITERRRAAEALRRSEERFRTIFEEAPLGVAVIDSLTAQFYEVNPRFAQIAGRSREEMATLDWTRVTHPDDVQEDLDNMAAMNAGKIPGFTMRKRYLHPDGSCVWIQMTIAPLKVADPRQPRHLCMIEDITDRLRAEKEVQDSELRYRSLVQATSQLVWTTNPAGLIDRDIPAWREFTGQTLEEMLGIGWLEALHPDDRTVTATAWTQAIAERRPYETEYRIRGRDGQYRDFVARGVPVLDAAGNVREWIGTCTDITDRKQAERALQQALEELRATNEELQSNNEELVEAQQTILEQRQFYQDLFLFAPSGYLVTDRLGVIERANEGAAQLLRRRQEWLQGKPLIDFVVEAEHTDFYARLGELGSGLLDRIQDWEVTLRVGPKREVVVPASVSVAALRSGDGTLIGLRWLIADITDRRRAEEALKQARDEAERRAREVQERERILTAMMDNIPIGITLADAPDGHIRMMSRWGLQLLGELPADVIGVSAEQYSACWDVRHTDDVTPMDTSEIALTRALRNGEVVTAQELTATRRDGSRVMLLCTAGPIRDETGRITGAVVGWQDITERKQMELALRVSEARFRSLVLATTQVVWVTDASGQVTTDMPSWRAFTGQTTEEMQGSGWSNALHPDDRERTLEIWTEAVRTRSVYETEYQLRWHGGGYRYVAVRGAPVLGPDGQVQEWVGTCSDITDRKQAELQRARLAAIVESTDEAIIGTTSNGIIETWNHGAERLYGYTAAEITGKSVTVLVPPDRLSEWTQVMERVHRGEQVPTHETQRRHKDGHLIEVAVTISPLKDAAGRVVGASAISRNITERKRAEQELKQLNRALRAISHCNEALIRATEEQQLLNRICQLIVEDAGYRMCWVGYPQMDEACTVRPIAWAGVEDNYLAGADIRWSDTERGRGPTGIALRTGQACICDDIVSDPRMAPWRDDALRRGFHSCVAFPFKEGEHVIGMLAVYASEPDAFSSDEVRLLTELVDDLAFGITTLRTRAERKRAEEEIRALNAELEQRVQERTAELGAANKELEAFAYSVSHDLRAPLRAIDGFSRILQMDYLDILPEKPRHYLQLVCDNTRQMGRLIDDLLRFSRTSRQALQLQTVSPRNLVEQCLEDLKPEMEGRRIEIRIADLPPCEADGSLLKQVWLNLIANALKYTRKRDPAVIEIGSQSHDDEPVYFVKDNGVGFDMQYANKLFGVFQRLHAAEDYEGTGIGLALVQRILHRHGGRAWAEAAVDRGATFYFTVGKGSSHD